MTRKDYHLIAGILQMFNADPPIHEDLVRQFAAMLEHDNPRFDRSRFYEAANYKPEKEG